MTAEIAILNRAAVTLAADSAMTLSGGTTEKIYNSVDKIFELSHHDPIEIMIYNTLDFMRVPLELIIKMFRESKHCKPFDSVSEAAEAFFVYIENEISATNDDKQHHVSNLVSYIFARVRKHFEESVERLILSHAGTRRGGFNVQPTFLASVDYFTKIFAKMSISPNLAQTSEGALKTQYAYGIDDAISRNFGTLPLDASDKALLISLAVLSLRADYCSEMRTGFVFSGYGRAQIFPSLVAFEADGLITNTTKRRKIKSVDIDRSGSPAEIIPFAQREMVDRFLYGIDPEFQKAIETVLRQNLADIGGTIISNVPRIGKKTRNDLTKKLDAAVHAAISDFRDHATPDIKEEFWNQIRDTVLFMTKPDLAHFAESLVNITSIKRRVSLEQETVGGPIDVAVISRTDGFVWVKRKHYFEASINHSYFHRKYGTTLGNP